MSLVIDLAPETEKLLAAEWGDLNKAAFEALIIESYRQGKLSLGQCGEILGMTAIEAESFFRLRGVDLSLTADDVDRDCVNMERALD